MSNLQSEIEKLRAANKVLESENEQLSERAEDAMLLGLVAEAIEGLTDPQAVIDQVLERISILKNLPFVTFGQLREGMVDHIASYAAFSDEPESGYPIQLTTEICSELKEGPYLADTLQGINTRFAQEVFSANAALLIPFHCHHYGDGVFLFFDHHSSGSRLASMLFLLDQVVRLTSGRLENIFLAQQLAFLNAELEERVLLKTEDLRTANSRLTLIYERFVSVLDGVDSYIHVIDTKNHTILFANKAAKDLFGEKIEGQRCYRALMQENKPCVFCKIPGLLTAQSEVDKSVIWESFNSPTGRWFLNSERIVDWPDVPAALLTVGTNITELKKTVEEKQQLAQSLLQAQKMEAIGLLAGGVAHDFNNMLGVILGHSELAMKQLAPSHPLYSSLKNINSAAERSADLTRQLLAFARKQTVAPKVLDLNQVIEGMVDMLTRLIGENIDLAWLPGKNLGAIKMDPSQIDQIMMNLCVNARDAIGDTGKVTIETNNAAFDAAICAKHADFVPGEYALLAVSDNGCGMNPETVSHLFEPFFTTKDTGQGTGLGLATVYGIVRQNNGFINVYSEPGQGTTFKVYLPLHATKTEQATRTSAAEPAGRGHETILLVEDEPLVLDMTRDMLEAQGYTVLPAGSPGEAIRLTREHTGSISLLMTDVVMPEMNGRDLAKNLLAIHPHLKRLFMSGYTANVIAHHGVLDEGVHFIQKPFTMNDLAAKIREALK